MVQANTQAIQNEIEDFTPDEKIYFSVGNVDYSKVQGVKFNKKKPFIDQCFADIPHAGQDCRDLSSLLAMYDFDFRDKAVGVPGTDEYKPQNRYISENATK